MRMPTSNVFSMFHSSNHLGEAICGIEGGVTSFDLCRSTDDTTTSSLQDAHRARQIRSQSAMQRTKQEASMSGRKYWGAHQWGLLADGREPEKSR